MEINSIQDWKEEITIEAYKFESKYQVTKFWSCIFKVVLPLDNLVASTVPNVYPSNVFQ